MCRQENLCSSTSQDAPLTEDSIKHCPLRDLVQATEDVVKNCNRLASIYSSGYSLREDGLSTPFRLH